MGHNYYEKIILLSFAVLLTSRLAACGEAEVKKADADNKAENAGENKAEKKSKEKPETQELAIGDAVEFDGIKITLNEARIESGGEFD